MGVQILFDQKNEIASIYCSTSDWSFGPVFYERDGIAAYQVAEGFLFWLRTDVREFSQGQLESKYAEFCGLNLRKTFHELDLCGEMNIEFECDVCTPKLIKQPKENKK